VAPTLTQQTSQRYQLLLAVLMVRGMHMCVYMHASWFTSILSPVLSPLANFPASARGNAPECRQITPNDGKTSGSGGNDACAAHVPPTMQPPTGQC
jgi:hypothetical protein